MHFGNFIDMKGISQLFQGFKSTDMLDIYGVTNELMVHLFKL